MKMKRLIALILCICLMSSLLVPVVSATEASGGNSATNSATSQIPGSKEEPYQVIYDFDYDEVFSKKTDLTAADASASLSAAYQAGTVNTNLYGYYNQTGTAPYCMYYSTEEGAFLMGRISDETKPYPWMAYEVAELHTGSYTVDLEYKSYVNGTRALEVYMIPVSVVNAVDTATVADADDNGTVDTVDVIESLLQYTDSKGVNPYLTGTQSTQSSATSIKTASLSIDFKVTSQEKHIMVFRATKTNKSTQTNAHICVQSVTFTYNYPYIAPTLAEDTYVYDFSPEGFKDLANAYDDNNLAIMETQYKDYESYWAPYAVDKDLTSNVVYSQEGGKWNFDGLWANTYAGQWFALKIVAPGEGEYALSLERRRNTSSARKSNVYIIPLETVDGAEDPEAAIEAAMEDDTYLFSSLSFRGTGSAYSETVVLGEYDFDAGQQYVLVFKGVTGKSSTSDQAQMCPQNLTAIKKTYGDGVYDFVEESYVGLDTSSVVDAEGTTVNQSMTSWYQIAGTNWTVEGMSSRTASFSTSGITYAGDEGSWLALRVKLPEAGTYSFSLKHPVSAKGALMANVYVIEAAAATMTAEEIKDAMIPEALIGSATFNGTSSGNATSDLGIYLGQGDCKEYVVVFDIAQGSQNGADIYLNELTIEKKQVVTWDFDMADSKSGFSGWGAKTMSEMKSQLDAYFADGTLNWYVHSGYSTRSGYETDAFLGVDFQRSYGLRMMANLDSWYAFGIQSPGTGTYTLSLNHAVYSYGASECAVYIIEKPAAGTDMNALVSKLARNEDPIGVANMYAGSGYTDGYTTVIGTYDFEAGKEYVAIIYSLAPRTGYDSGVGYMMVSQLVAVEGVMNGATSDVVSTVDLGNTINSLYLRVKVSVVEVNGIDYYYLPIQGGQLLVYNLDTMEKVSEVTCGVSNAWGCDVTSDGTVYICGDSKNVFKYNVITGEQEKIKIKDDHTTAYDLEVQENGDFYMGIRGGYVAKYDAASDEMIFYKELDPTGVADTCYAVAYKDGYIYAHLTGEEQDADGNTVGEIANIVKIDEATGEVVKQIDVSSYLQARYDEENYSTSDAYRCMTIVGDMIICGAPYLNYFSCFDVDTLEYVDLGLPMGCSGDVSEIRDGKAYCTIYKGGLVEIDVENRTAKSVQGMSSVGIPLRCHKYTFVTINHSDLPGESLFTCSTTYKGAPTLYNLETKATVSYEDLTDGEGSSVELRGLCASNDGSGMVYVGAYTVTTCNGYSVKDEAYTYQFRTLGQTDSLYMYKGILYAGCYAGCQLAQVNSTSGTSVELVDMNSDVANYHQKRIHFITGGDDKIFFSTVPDNAMLGGCLVAYDIADNEVTVHENFVRGQIILSMFYKDGLLYGCTSTAGGTNSEPTETVAKLFVYDVKNAVKLGEFEVELEGLPEKIPFIQAVGLNEADGTMWGAIAETLFTFTYDRKSNTMSFTEQLSFSKTKFNDSGNRDWFGVPMIFHEGYLYYSFGNSGFRRINLSDMSYSDKLIGTAPKQYAIAEDGNLYYTSSRTLKMLPLNYDDSDWAAARKVDEKIRALDTNVTKANASKVQAVLDAYNALSNVQKGLVQESSTLFACQRRMVVVMIDSLPSELTLEDKPQVEAVRAAYTAVSALQKRFVDNIDTLVNAEGDIRYLEYLVASEEAAALVMQHIENIPANITMAAANKINVARNTYNALNDYQRSLVTNYQKLLDAEAALQVLVTAQNQVYADKVIAQIDALGTITLRSQKAIMMARLAYGALTDEQKALVTNYQKLVDAELELENLQKNGDANIKAVEAVEALIKLIGDEISLDSGDAIKAARKAYDALTDFQKTLVNNIDDLVEAEKLYGELKAEQDQMILIIAIIVVVVVIGAGVATVMIIPATRSKILGLFKKKEAKAEAESEAEAEAE